MLQSTNQDVHPPYVMVQGISPPIGYRLFERLWIGRCTHMHKSALHSPSTTIRQFRQSLLVSGGVGSTYFSRQPFGGVFPVAANLACCSASQRLRRSARMRSSSFDAGSVALCFSRHSAVSLPSTAAFSTAAR